MMLFVILSPVSGLMSSCFCFSISDAVLEIVMELEAAAAAEETGGVPVGVLAGATVVVGLGPATRWLAAAAFLSGSVTTVMDRLFLPGSMYVSFTHTIPSRRLALTLDAVTDDDDDMDAGHKNNDIIALDLPKVFASRIDLPAMVAGTAVTVAPPGMTGRRL